MITGRAWSLITQEIEDIPGNGPVLERLCHILEKGEALALVGAGCSAELWPLCHDFLQGLIEYNKKYRIISPEDAKNFRKEILQDPLKIAQQLRYKMSDPLYFEYFHNIYSDKVSAQTGGCFTLAQQALLQLPIRNYLTMSYDAGLTNARAALFPKATTSYYFWDQEETKRILNESYKLLVLHVHGRYDRNDSIILTKNDYERFYRNDTFIHFLDHIFASATVLIVGFSLNDPYVTQLFYNISKDHPKESRHVALVGFDKKKDLVEIQRWRERFTMLYGAHILFYPATNNHQILTDWLMVLAQQYPRTTDVEIRPPFTLDNVPTTNSKVKANFQDEIDSVNSGSTHHLRLREYSEPVILKRSIIIDGCGSTICALEGPVITIKSPGVTLRNLTIEYTGDGGMEKPSDECAIFIEPGLNVSMENVKVRGTVIGLPSEEGEWRYPVSLSLGPLTSGFRHTFILHLVVPVHCTIESSIYGMKLNTQKLDPGPNEILINIDEMPQDRIRGYIIINTPLLIRTIAINANITVQNSIEPDLKKTSSIIWEPKDWAKFSLGK